MHKYLLRPDVRRQSEKLFADFLKKAPVLPPDVDLRGKMPPIWDQGELGACQSYAIDAIDQYLKGYPFTPSHIFTYYNVRSIEGIIDVDGGGTLSDTCNVVKKYGVCSADIWPNDIAQFTVKPSDEAYANARSNNDEIYSFYRALTVDEARQALAAGHIPYIGIRVYENFESNQTLLSGTIPSPRGKLLGGHALVLAGYVDTAKNPLTRLICGRSNGYFIVRNSWGTGIGIDGTGYFQVDYNVFQKLLMDMWIVVK